MGENLTFFEFLFLFLIFGPGIIRGAFWYDFPAFEGVMLTVGIFVSLGILGWISKTIDSRLFFGVVGLLIVIPANIYAIKGSNFYSSSNKINGDTDGDIYDTGDDD